MKSCKKILFYIIISFLIVNCSIVKKFARQRPSGSEFDKNLTKFYQDYVKSEKKKNHWKIARKFSMKGMDLLIGNYIFSEDPKLMDINDEYLPELIQARKDIESILENPKILDLKPVTAAKALSSFDCWVEEQAANWDKDSINKCKNNFYISLNEIKKILEEEAKSSQKLDIVTEKDIEYAKPPKKIPTEIIYFSHNQHKLSKNNIRKIAELVASTKDYQAVNLNCYANRLGQEWYNYNLSKKRCISVGRELVKLGIKKEKINLHPHGIYVKPYILSSEKNSPENRKVEINFDE